MTHTATIELQRAAVQLLGAAGVPGLADMAAQQIAEFPWGSWDPHRAWAECGAQALTAVPGPPPGDVAGRMSVAGLVLDLLAQQGGVRAPKIDGAALIGERAALASDRFHPAVGRTLRGTGRMVRARDGWLALNLPRTLDTEMLPALTEGQVQSEDEIGLDEWLSDAPTDQVLERAALLGMAICRVPEGTAKRTVLRPWLVTDLGPAPQHPDHAPRVVDFSGLWAGPLGTSLLASMGADVVRVVGRGRPEAPSPNDEDFNNLLADGTRRLVADLGADGVMEELLADADVVVTSSRVHTLKTLGIRADSKRIWVRITAHGAIGPDALRVGFGDDAAASVGAIVRSHGAPVFAADALADPLTGLLSAVAATAMLATGRAGVIDLSLARSARWACAGPAYTPSAGHWPSAPPRARKRTVT
jgi:hypothetical protein